MFDKKLEKAANKCHAEITTKETGEKWLGRDGKIYNIDRKPIDWDLIIKKEQDR